MGLSPERVIETDSAPAAYACAVPAWAWLDFPAPAFRQIGLVDIYHCTVARHHEIFYLWCPFLRDSKDDMLLELAVKSGARYIVTYNERDFDGSERFGVTALTPATFLRKIGELP